MEASPIHSLLLFTPEAEDLPDPRQSDIRNPLSLLAHNRITASQFIRRCSNVNCQEGFTKDSFKHPKVEWICDKCGSELTVRSDDNEETVRKRLQIYHDSTEPLLEWFKSSKVEIKIIKEDDSQDDFLFALF